MVAGDAVNTAARVQAAADAGPGAGRRGHPAARRRRHRLRRRRPAHPEGQGRAGAAVARRPGRRPASAASQRVDGLEAPLTGRDAELRTIKELFHAARRAAHRRGWSCVAGPAGVGKSRLGWEFEKYVDGLADVVRWHRGRCLSYGEGVAVLGAGRDGPAAARHRRGRPAGGRGGQAGRRASSEWLPDADERALRRHPAGPAARRRRSPATPAPSCRGRSCSPAGGCSSSGWPRREPVVLMVEDAQHADRGLLDFLDHLVDWARDLPVFVLVLARPELDDGRPGFGTGRNRVAAHPRPARRRVDARRWSTRSCPACRRGAATRSPPRRRASRCTPSRRSARSIDRDVVQPDRRRLPAGRRRRRARRPGQPARAARRSARRARRRDARRLVADAAVLGTTFPAEALVAVSGLDAGRVPRRGWPSCCGARCSTSRPTRCRRSAAATAFAQDLLRQVAYDTLSRRDRKARHLAVAAHLRATFAERRRGGRRRRRPALPRRARRRARRRRTPTSCASRPSRPWSAAAERAARTGAPDRASRSYAQAADLLEEAGDRPAARRHSVRTSRPAAHASGDRGRRPGRRADHRALHRTGRDRAAARSRTQLGRALMRLGRYTAARRDARRGDRRPAPRAGRRHGQGAGAARHARDLRGTPEADAATVEVLRLAQALELGPRHDGRRACTCAACTWPGSTG